MNIYLVGYMYAGKTTLGRQLAHRLCYDFVDTDQLFECRFHTSIPLFFERYGEKAFRSLERVVLESTADLNNFVIATGGGTPIFADNMQWILAHGTVVYLEMSFDAICARMSRSHKVRPILQAMSIEERRCFIAQQLQLRDPIYRKAHLIFDAFNPDIDALVRIINQNCPPSHTDDE